MPIKAKFIATDTDFIVARLKGHEITCSGCESRLLIRVENPAEDTFFGGRATPWYEVCSEQVKTSNIHSEIDYLHGNTPSFCEICDRFSGISKTDLGMLMESDDDDFPMQHRELTTNLCDGLRHLYVFHLDTSKGRKNALKACENILVTGEIC